MPDQISAKDGSMLGDMSARFSGRRLAEPIRGLKHRASNHRSPSLLTPSPLDPKLLRENLLRDTSPMTVEDASWLLTLLSSPEGEFPIHVSYLCAECLASAIACKLVGASYEVVLTSSRSHSCVERPEDCGGVLASPHHRRFFFGSPGQNQWFRKEA